MILHGGLTVAEGNQLKLYVAAILGPMETLIGRTVDSMTCPQSKMQSGTLLEILGHSVINVTSLII